MGRKKLLFIGGRIHQQPITPDISNIEENKEAQEYLWKRSLEIPPEQLFEEIYVSCQEHGAKMKAFRERRREAKKDKISGPQEPSYFDSHEKEDNLYDLLAKEDTKKAMTWLKAETKRRLLDQKRQKAQEDTPRIMH